MNNPKKRVAKKKVVKKKTSAKKTPAKKKAIVSTQKPKMTDEKRAELVAKREQAEAAREQALLDAAISRARQNAEDNVREHNFRATQALHQIEMQQAIRDAEKEQRNERRLEDRLAKEARIKAAGGNEQTPFHELLNAIPKVPHKEWNTLADGFLSGGRYHKRNLFDINLLSMGRHPGFSNFVFRKWLREGTNADMEQMRMVAENADQYDHHVCDEAAAAFARINPSLDDLNEFLDNCAAGALANRAIKMWAKNNPINDEGTMKALIGRITTENGAKQALSAIEASVMVSPGPLHANIKLDGMGGVNLGIGSRLRAECDCHACYLKKAENPWGEKIKAYMQCSAFIAWAEKSGVSWETGSSVLKIMLESRYATMSWLAIEAIESEIAFREKASQKKPEMREALRHQKQNRQREDGPLLSALRQMYSEKMKDISSISGRRRAGEGGMNPFNLMGGGMGLPDELKRAMEATDCGNPDCPVHGRSSHQGRTPFDPASFLDDFFRGGRHRR